MPEAEKNTGSLEAIKRYFVDFKVLADNPFGFWIVQGINFLDSAAYFGIISVITLFLTESSMGFGEDTGGYVVTAFTTLITLSYFVSGFVTDALGIRKSLLISQGTNVIARFGILATVLLGLPGAPWIAVGLLLLTAPGLAMTGTAFQTANKRLSSVRSRSASFNVWYLVMNLGGVASGFAVDYIRKELQIGTVWIFLFGAVAALLALAGALAVTRETQVGEDPSETTPEAPKKGAWESFLLMVEEPAFWRFTALIALLLGVRAVFSYMYLLMPIYWVRVIEEVTGEPTNQGLLQALNPILIATGLILFIPFANRFNVFKMLVFGAMISSLSLLAMTLPWATYTPLARLLGLIPQETPAWVMAQSYFVMSAVMLSLLSIGEVIWSPKLTEYTAAIAPEGQEGAYLGLSGMPWFVASLAVSSMSGKMLQTWVPEGIGARLLAGEVPFWERPEAMWLILFIWAFSGPLIALTLRGWLTKGAKLDAVS